MLRLIFTPRMLVSFLMGFSCGVPLLLTLSVLQAWMKEEGVDLSVIGLFALVGLPYTLKFFWSPVLDRFTLPFLGRRRGWLLVVQILLVVAIAGLGLTSPRENPWLVAFAALLVTFFSASQDIVVDAYRREDLRDMELGLGSSLYVNGYRVGMLLAGSGGLIMADHFSFQQVYLVPGRQPAGRGSRPPCCAGSRTCRRGRRGQSAGGGDRSVYRIFQAGPGNPDPFLYPALQDRRPDGLDHDHPRSTWISASPRPRSGRWPSCSVSGRPLPGGCWAALFSCGSASGRPSGGSASCRRSRPPVFPCWPSIGNSVPALAAVIAFENLSGGMGTAAYVAFMASITNKKFTATQYALLSSLMGVPRVIASAPTGFMVESIGWFAFFIICTVIAVPGLFLLRWIDS